jgi:hypothetical protein
MRINAINVNRLGTTEKRAAKGLWRRIVAHCKFFHLSHRTWYHWVFVIGGVIVVFLVLCNILNLTGTIALLSALGFFYTQHARDTQFFHELFREFNARYDRLKGRLNDICNRPEKQPLDDPRNPPANQRSKDTDKSILCEYFNLCAEEWIYHKAGYIDPTVWCAWHSGMQYFAENAEIREFWKKELQEQDSYYGFRLD